MSVGRFLQQAAAGNAGGATYVDDVFSTYLYDGTGSEQTITNGIDLAGEGGLVWIKNRNNTGVGGYHLLFDTARSPTNSDPMYFLRSNETDAQQSVYDNGANRDFVGWESNGFTLGDYYSLASEALNGSGTGPYCSWTFRKQPGFFDVVTYTGDSTSGRTVSHNLGTVPGMIIVKRMTGSGSWAVYHRSTGNTKALFLEMTTAEYADSGYWNNTDPTDSVFTLGNSTTVNNSGQDYVAYLFAHDAQDFGTNSDEAIIKCGTYTGNGSASGVEVDLGFEPQWLLVKTASGTGSHKNWWLLDNMRGISTGSNETLLAANLSDAETGNADIYDLTATGFIAKNTSQANQSGMNYIYVAIRRPHKPASEFAATDLFSMDAAGQQTSNPAFVSNGHVVDMAFEKTPSSTVAFLWFSRLTGSKYLNSSSTAAEGTGSSVQWDYMSGVVDGFSGANLYQAWMFRRAPGFFDVVAYTGDGSAGRNINHNLGVAPELMIIKQRNATRSWAVYNSSSGTGKFLKLEDAAGEVTQSGVFDTAPTESVFTVETNTYVNINGGFYISYLFATVPGISKVGSYSGTGSDVNVDCGFTSGARFVLVKRTDSTGDWYLWDSVRGIVAGNDPYLFLNSTAAQVTSTDYIDPLSSGFTITSSAPAALNASGGNYIFLAIA